MSIEPTREERAAEAQREGMARHRIWDMGVPRWIFDCLDQVVLMAFLLILAAQGVSFGADAPSWQGVVVHHSASEAMSLEDCNTWHKAKGWDGCGYNFIIQPDGVVEEARGLGRIGAHVSGHNSKYLGVCLIGDFREGRTPTKAQLESFGALFWQTMKALDASSFEVRGHQEFKATECPGDDTMRMIYNAVAR